ncbi:MAG: response regulator transcription factor [Calditrichales bacterium]|nr:MAG: response regulator transcription factor [Calditrichales bacterium]
MNKDAKIGQFILLVEDEESLAIGLEFNLKEEGYEVDWASDGRKALDFLETNHYDLLILDIMLPYVNGFEIARTVRESDPQMPILMLTARTDAKDRVKGLELGADDYMTKPFHLRELLLRVNGMLRRKQWYSSATADMPLYVFGDNEINFESLTGTARGKKIDLTVHEAMLLKYLVDCRGKVVSREELLKKVWNITSKVETRTVDNFIVRLRKYFESDPAKPQFIKSKRGIGYYFTETESKPV